MLTAYDYPTAKILSEAGIDILLVGDSLGMVVLGYKDTKSVTLEDMIRHGAAVVRGNKGSFVVVDMPIHSTDTFPLALRNCELVLRKTGANAVKIEGQAEVVFQLAEKGIPVMGHTGLKPQTAEKYGLRGNDDGEADLIYEEALSLEKAGIFALVLECIPSFLTQKITRHLRIPTIGIGAGNLSDGQVLVVSDMLGLFNDFKPKFVRRYLTMSTFVQEAARQFKKDVGNGTFPSVNETLS